MKFFEAVPSELFSPLASPNRILYADALDVLYAAYQENLKIREDVLYSMLRGRLERELADATFEDEDIDEEELRDISGRARFLIRKLCSKGWFEKERGDDFEEYITIPNYSSRLLELFHQLRDDSPARGYSYVFGTHLTVKSRKKQKSCDNSRPDDTFPAWAVFIVKNAAFPKSRAEENTRKMPLLRNSGAERSLHENRAYQTGKDH